VLPFVIGWQPSSDAIHTGDGRLDRGAHRGQRRAAAASDLPDGNWVAYVVAPTGRREERGWEGRISAALPLADARLVAVAATDQPTEEDKRRRAERDDAMVWGERVPYSRLRLLDLATGDLEVVDGLGNRHVVELAQRPDGGPLAVISWICPEIDPGVVTNELHVIDLHTGAVRA
jgi:hypothetical protein